MISHSFKSLTSKQITITIYIPFYNPSIHFIEYLRYILFHFYIPNNFYIPFTLHTLILHTTTHFYTQHTTHFTHFTHFSVFEIVPYGCYFHYFQSAKRKLENLGLKVLYSNDVAFQIIVRSFYALAFIRPNELRPTFDQLVESIPQNYRDMENFEQFITYYQVIYYTHIYTHNFAN